MLTTIQIHLCGRCSSEQVRKNGRNGGRAKYQCTACAYQGYLQPAAPARAARHAQGEKLLAERNSQRSIVRATGVSRMSVAKRAKKSGASGPAAAAPAAEESPAPAMGGTRTG